MTLFGKTSLKAIAGGFCLRLFSGLRITHLPGCDRQCSFQGIFVSGKTCLPAAACAWNNDWWCRFRLALNANLLPSIRTPLASVSSWRRLLKTAFSFSFVVINFLFLRVTRVLQALQRACVLKSSPFLWRKGTKRSRTMYTSIACSTVVGARQAVINRVRETTTFYTYVGSSCFKRSYRSSSGLEGWIRIGLGLRPKGDGG